MAISSDESLLALAGSSHSNSRTSNMIYLFNISVIKNTFNLTLLDTIEIPSKSNKNDNDNKEKDYISSLFFAEKKVDNFLLALTKNSAVLRIFGIKKDRILNVVEEGDFSEIHDKGNCRLFKREILVNECDFYLASNKGIVHRFEFKVV